MESRITAIRTGVRTGRAGATKEGAVKSTSRVQPSDGSIVLMSPNGISFYPVNYLLEFIFVENNAYT